MIKLGIIGYGSRMSNFIDFVVETGLAVPVAIADTQIEAAKARAIVHGFNDIAYYMDAKSMLQQEKLDGICIGTRCSLHTHYALLAAEYGVPVFLEKPVATAREDLERLCTLLDKNEKFLISFPLRFTKIVRYVKEIVDSGKIGQIQHIQAYNNVPYARGYYHKWYRDDKETGGLFLQKATHDFDYINYLLGDNKPVEICAMESKQIFKGNKPAGQMCVNCPDAAKCPESPENVQTYGDPYAVADPCYCCFAEDTGNHDSGSAIIKYENGMHVVYSQNFVTRKGAQKRGARLIGYYGTLEFDFYTGIVTIYHHNDSVTETHKLEDTGAHFGGDPTLALNFVNMIRGMDSSKAPLSEGILSAKMCLAARESAENNTFYSIQ